MQAGITLAELEELEKEEATAILRTEWNRCDLASYPSGLDYFMFDCSLFCGRNVSIGWLGSALRRLDIRGIDDEGVAAQAVSALAPIQTTITIEQIAFLRRRRHKSLPDCIHFMSAWTNRVTRVQKRAQHILRLELALAPEAAECHVG